MNNFTKTESLPKSGHVTEVCKEWLVREDSALAYKLQSQEINDFYKGNRFRNAVVREDFPTALNEQIKEKENAEKQSELHRRRLREQEEYDKRVAKEISQKLERDLQEQQQRELQESEIMAQQMQEIYVNLPPPNRSHRHPPPRPAKASTTLQTNTPLEASNSNAGYSHNHQQQPQQQQAVSHSHNHNHAQPSTQHAATPQSPLHYSSPQSPLKLQQQHFSNTDCYVALSVPASSRQKPTSSSSVSVASGHVLVSDGAVAAAHQPTTSTSANQFVERSKAATRSPQASTADNLNINNGQAPFSYHQQLQPHSLSSSVLKTSSILTTSSTATTSSLPSAAAATRRNIFESITPNISHQSSINDAQSLNPNQITPPTHNSMHTSTVQHDVEEIVEYSDVADSIRRYDMPTGADATDASPSKHPNSQLNTNFNRFLSPSYENLLKNEQKFQKLSPEKYDQLVGNDVAAPTTGAAAERHMQAHADDIELYVDPCDYASLKEIGLPMEEIKEMSKKLKQEQKDELLARRLQEMESRDGLSQEERDRLLAIEAQDKELAKMLQEREKAKAKRAKEKARLRKSQQKESNSGSSSLCSTSNGMHCGPLLPLPQDCFSLSKHSVQLPASTALNHAHAQTEPEQEDPIDVEAYSNPIDVINNHQQRMQNGTLTNGSLTRDAHMSSSLNRQLDDDIYTLPVDSCRPGERPASLSMEREHMPHGHHNNSMTRSENYSLDSHDSLNGRMSYSKSGTFDQSPSPTPPYMPIPGTRRSNSSENRKKKSKDKCTHQ